MKLNGFPRNLMGVLLVLCLASLLTGCCGELPPEVQRDLDNLWEQIWQGVERQASELLEQFKQWMATRAHEQAQAWLSNMTDRLKEWAGLEAPADAGVLDDKVHTETSPSTLAAAFADAYKRIGGGRTIGWPAALVTLSEGLFIQYYEGGSQERSAIVMREHETIAYVIPGPWLTQYEALGGPARAGYPTTDPEKWGVAWWKFWVKAGQGERQLYALHSETYAIMKANGSGVVRCVPPRFWETYLAAGGAEKMGYPLSSYPLDDSAWRELAGLGDEARSVLHIWSEQPYRAQIFQRGSILFTSDWQKSEVVHAEGLFGGQTKLLGGVGAAFSHKYFELSAPDECSSETIRHAANVANKEFVNRLVTRVTFAPLEGALAVGTAACPSPICRIGLTCSRYVLELAQADDPRIETVWFVAGMILDSFYSKAVGDLLSKPLTHLTVDVAKADFAKVYSGRLSVQVSVAKSPRPGPLSPTMNVHVFAMYDRFTHMVSGVVTSDCAPDGIAFQFRIDPYSGLPVEKVDGVWDGQARYWSLPDGTPK